MSPDLFRQVIEARPSAPASRLSALPVSIAVHALVLAALVVIPLLASDVLPNVRGTDIVTLPVVIRPTPPVAPVRVARRAPMAESIEVGAAPVDAPNGIGRELMLVTTPSVDRSVPGGSGSIPGTGVPGGLGIVDTDTPPPIHATAPIRGSALLEPPVKIRDVSPVYPEAARLARVEGKVVIEAVIGPTGEVVNAVVLRSTPLLDEAALAAVRQWRYTPTLLNGIPMSVVLTVTVNFSLK
jgi:periplasmic protein TonB